jgi:UDP-N-acetylmuramoylalanine-D-glutamate ligase
VKSALATANVATAAQDVELAQVAILTAVMNQDGEGSTDFQKYARKRLVAMGVVEPNEDEKAAMEQAAEQQSQQPDPTMILTEAQSAALKGAAMKDAASAQKIMADIINEKAAALIDAFNAETNRIKAFMSKDAPVPADTSEKVAPVIDQAVTEALASPDVLPPAPRIRRGYEVPAEQPVEQAA